MIVEYIIDKDEFKKKIDSLNFTASNGKEVTRKNPKAKGKNNYFLKLSCAGNDIDAAQALSEISLKVEDVFHQNDVSFRLLTNEASQFFVKELYPSVCEFETKLRKFIHSTLFDVDEGAKVKVLSRLKGTLIEKSSKEIPAFDYLEKGTLESIRFFLFSNNALYGAVKDYTSGQDAIFASREQLIQFIQDNDSHTIWEDFFEKDFSDSILPAIFKDIIDCRNDVMHFHNISYERYLEGADLLNRGINDLNKQIKKGIVIEDSSANVSKLSRSLGYLDAIAHSIVSVGAASARMLDVLFSPEVQALKNKYLSPVYLDTLGRLAGIIADSAYSVPMPPLPGINVPTVPASILGIASAIPAVPSLQELGIYNPPASEAGEAESRKKANTQEGDDDNR